MSNKIKIKVKSEVGLGTTSDMEVEPNKTVRELKEEIAVAQACEASRTALTYQGKVLDENARIGECSLKDGDQVSLVPNHRTGGRMLPPDLQARRISLESQMIKKERIALDPENPFLWHGIINGKGKWKGRYKISIIIPIDYPYKAPIVKWETLLYPKHPNIDYNGGICLNILNNDWRPEFTLITVYRSLEWLLENPHYHEWDLPYPNYGYKPPKIENSFLANIFLERMIGYSKPRREIMPGEF